MDGEKRKMKAFQRYHRAGGREERRERLERQSIRAWCWETASWGREKPGFYAVIKIAGRGW